MSCNDCCWTGRVGEREEEEIRVSYIKVIFGKKQASNAPVAEMRNLKHTEYVLHSQDLINRKSNTKLDKLQV